MKSSIIKLLNIVFISFILLFSLSINSFAKVINFKVSLEPDTTQVGKAVDITIKAIDENGDIDKNYTGTIGIVEGTNTTSGEVEFPGFADTSYPSYTFTKSDEGVKKFENAIKFLKEGTKSIAVAPESTDDDIDGPTGEAEIIVKGGTNLTGKISIKSPNNNETLSKNSVKVIGNTNKNYKVQIKLNDNKTFSTISDSEGLFQIDVTNIPDGTNIVQAFLLDGDENIIGESEKVTFDISTVGPNLRSFTIDPEENIKSGDNINVEVLSEPEMEVNITVNEAVYNLTEDMEGKYIGNFPAPEKAGNYPIDLEITDDMGNKNEQKAAKTINVKASEKNDKITSIKKEPLKEKTNEKAIVCSEAKIDGLKLTKLKTKSILSWNKVNGAIGYKIFKKEGTNYNFIENIDENRYTIFIKDSKKITYADFSIKAVCEEKGKQIDSKEYSQATKIQTGPRETILFILFSMLISGLYFIFSRKKS